MIALMCTALLALLVKDVSYLNDRYVLRGLSQGLCLCGGLFWILMKARGISWKKYWMLFCYIGVITISVFFSDDQFHAGFQVLSLVAMLIFFIAVNEMQGHRNDRDAVLIRILLWSGIIICSGSLILVKFRPDLAYMTAIGDIPRLRGLFSMPGMIGSFTGLLFGVAVFTPKRRFLRLLLGVLAASCVFLTFSRGSWAGLLGATLLVYFRMSKTGLAKLLLAFCCVAIAVVLFASVTDTRISEKTVSSRIRVGNIGTFGGRTLLWEQCLDVFVKRPFTGYGFGTGEVVLSKRSGSAFTAKGSSSLPKRRSLHNGYVQALVDTGAFGLLFYFGLLSIAWFNLWRRRESRSLLPLYVVTFVAIANMAESVMYAAATTHSLLGWYYVVFGLSIGSRKAGVKKTEKPKQANERFF